MTPERVQELLAAATPGPWQAATAPAEGSTETKDEFVLSCSQPERTNAPLWVTWASNDTDDGFAYLVTAITGDGPTSEANAALIAAAPEIAAAYLELVGRLQQLTDTWGTDQDSISQTHSAILDDALRGDS